MIDTNKINEGVIENRIGLMSDELLAAFSDPASGELVAEVCRDHHLDRGDWIEIVQQAAAFVMLGLIHDYDLARELNDALGIEKPQLTKEIAEAIGVKLFAPLRPEIQAMYRPLSQEEIAMGEELGAGYFTPVEIDELDQAAEPAVRTGGLPSIIPGQKPVALGGIAPEAQKMHSAASSFFARMAEQKGAAPATPGGTATKPGMPAPVMIRQEANLRPIGSITPARPASAPGPSSPGTVRPAAPVTPPTKFPDIVRPGTPGGFFQRPVQKAAGAPNIPAPTSPKPPTGIPVAPPIRPAGGAPPVTTPAPPPPSNITPGIVSPPRPATATPPRPMPTPPGVPVAPRSTVAPQPLPPTTPRPASPVVSPLPIQKSPIPAIPTPPQAPPPLMPPPPQPAISAPPTRPLAPPPTSPIAQGPLVPPPPPQAPPPPPRPL